jgi:TrmH family RNA methyltransferase
MLPKTDIRLIRSLNQKKYRNHHGLFVIEGNKIVREMLACHLDSIHTIYASHSWLNSLPADAAGTFSTQVIDEADMKRISFLKTPQQALALAHIPDPEWNARHIKESMSLVLDTIQDPGNLGTIVRIADWFGISTIICSMDSADIYNPKTIQATMGSFMRVQVFYRDLTRILAEYSSMDGFPVCGTFPEGDSLYSHHPGDVGFVVLGNESKGISPALHPFITQRLMIPSFNPHGRPDSLNVAMAAAIVCSEFRRPRA